MKNHIFIYPKLNILHILKILGFGISAIGFSSYFLLTGKSLWWLILWLLGLFTTMHWGKMLFKGKISLGFLVKDEKLHIIYDHSKNIEQKSQAFLDGDYQTKLYEVNKLSHFWRYTLDLHKSGK